MNYLITYILAGIGSVIVIFWTFLFVRYRKSFGEVIAAMDSKQFMLPELFFIGFGTIGLLKINLRTESGRKKRKRIAEIYGEKYAEFYQYCILGGQITYTLTVAPMGLFVGALANDVLYAALVLAATAAIVASLDIEINNSVERRRDEILSDYAEVLSKLTLLVNAGLVVREAWSKVAYTSDRALYKEMQITSEEINNGVSELDAFFNFSQRCAVKEIRKLASALTQNLQNGSAELTLSLKYMSEESWEEKKQRAKQKGEVAGSKLMIPLGIMFAGILLMILVPIMANMF